MKIFILLLSLVSFSAMGFDKIQIGPSVKVIDVLHPLQVGIEARILDGYVGLSYHKGLMPEFALEGFDIKMNNSDFGVKVHPWKGSFYLGVLVGNQEVKVKTIEEISGQQLSVQGKIKGSYLTPHIGWQWRWESGFFLGMHVGWQLNSGAKTSVTTDAESNPLITGTQEYKDIKKDIEAEGNKLGKQALPNIGLLQLGWMF